MSGLGVTIISFSPNTLIKSADVNTNFSNLNNAATFTGGGTFTGTLSADGGKITSDGSGNISAVGAIQFSSGNETLKSHTGIVVIDFSGNTDLSLNAPNSGGSHHCYIKIGGVNIMRFDTNGNATLLGSLTQNGSP